MSDESSQLSSLRTFYDEWLITDVLNIVKSGKEATVYCCRAHPSTGTKLLAAKVYRSREFRNFKNDAVYQEGRVILDKRLRRAVKKKTQTGREVQFASWVEHEFQMLNLLYTAGADVPKPFAHSDPTILMEYVGDYQLPAPMLKNVSLEPGEAQSLFEILMSNVELCLGCNIVHADLSAYNILYWKGKVKIIDFPQAVDARFNPNAFSLLARDIDNLCRYFARYDVQANSFRLAEELWTQFLRAEL
jgi:RIO kinase 1